MQSLRRSLCIVWVVTACALNLQAQEAAAHYEGLRAALGLTATQMQELLRPEPPPARKLLPAASRRTRVERSAPYTPAGGIPADPERLRVLTSEQRLTLAAIAKVLGQAEFADLCARLQFIRPEQWPGATLCIYPVRVHRKLLDLTEEESEQLDRLDRSALPESALAMLTPSRRFEIGQFISNLDLASQAIDLRLIDSPMRGGEILCH